MRYLKLFEAFINDAKFYRFSKVEIPEGEFTPEKRTIWGSPEFNDSLVSFGFPDKSQCVHFMDSLAFNPEYKGLYGKNIYEIKVDDNSKLGWSFIVPINDWYYRGNTLYQAQRQKNPVIEEIMKTEFGSREFIDDKSIDEVVNFLIDFGVIGTGTLQDLKNSKFFGKEKVFVWTTDTVLLSKYVTPQKVKVGVYKSEKVLDTDDFVNRGLTKADIGKFYASEIGKLVKGSTREEALKLLDEWIKTL
jgi:hypothetical protein